MPSRCGVNLEIAAKSSSSTPRQERSESVIVNLDTESGREAAKPPEKLSHAPKIVDLGSYSKLDERAARFLRRLELVT